MHRMREQPGHFHGCMRTRSLVQKRKQSRASKWGGGVEYTVLLEILSLPNFLPLQEKRVWMVWRAGSDSSSPVGEEGRWWHLMCGQERFCIDFISGDRQGAEGLSLAGPAFAREVSFISGLVSVTFCLLS